LEKTSALPSVASMSLTTVTVNTSSALADAFASAATAASQQQSPQNVIDSSKNFGLTNLPTSEMFFVVILVFIIIFFIRAKTEISFPPASSLVYDNPAACGIICDEIVAEVTIFY
jgi:hypothetical protein